MKFKFFIKGNEIKKIVMESAYYLGFAASNIYTFNTGLYLNKLYTIFYSGWVFRSFKSCGKNFRVSSPVYGSGLKYISIGNNFVAGPRLRIEAHDRFEEQFFNPRILIGDNVNINFDCHIGCIGEIKIGNGVLIASKVLIIDHFHGETAINNSAISPIKRPLVSKGKISIGDNVWIGEGCVIMPGVSIGNNCIIGANSVVTKSFEDNKIIGGNPAKVIK
jgi:acetyltransferase-like isoleucine patch superfamily enzyme